MTTIMKHDSRIVYDEYKKHELIKCKNDLIYFIKNYIYILTPVNGLQLFNLYDRQKEYIDFCINNDHVIASVPRQFGKTACASGMLLWNALFNCNQILVYGAMSQYHAADMISQIIQAYNMLPGFLKPGIERTTTNEIVFDNGIKILSRKVDSNIGCGMHVSFMYLDEFAFVEPRIAQDFMNIITPMLVTGSKCIISSTPNNNGLFDDLYDNAIGNIGNKFNAYYDE